MGEPTSIPDPDNASAYTDGIRRTNNFYAETSLTLRQHLLKDFWIDQDRMTLQFRRKDLEVSQQVLRFQIMRTVLGVELGYYDLIAARERVKVEEQALELKRQFVAETRRRVEVGDLPPLDGEQAETQLQNTLTALASAEELHSTLENALKKQLTDNFQEWADLELDPADALLAIQPAVNRSESFQRGAQESAGPGGGAIGGREERGGDPVSQEPIAAQPGSGGTLRRAGGATRSERGPSAMRLISGTMITSTASW